MIKRRKNQKSFFAGTILEKSTKSGQWSRLKSVPILADRFAFSSSHLLQRKDEDKKDERRVYIVCLILFLFFVVIILRLFFLQIIEGKKNRALAEGNRVQIDWIHAPRGAIYDREGQVLASNIGGFRLVRGDETKQITHEQAMMLEKEDLASEKKEGSLGKLEVDLLREYSLGDATSHVLGFVGEITGDELEKDSFYILGDRVGRGGIEETYEEFLRGIRGGSVVERDAQGEKVRTVGKKEAKAGRSLKLTIDSGLQEILYKSLSKAMSKSSGFGAAAVAQNPKTGEILALTSLPSFDPSILTEGKDEEEVINLLSDSGQPMFNRAIQGVYPIGSIFKIVTALAGLEESKISAQTQFEDTGIMYLGEYEFPNWYFLQYGKKDGLVDIVKAMKRSNDIFFYQVGRLLGVEKLARWSKKLGLGRETKIDLPQEAAGLVPTPEWKEETKGQIWFPGDTLHMAIGQGDVLASPLQVSVLTSYVANGGILLRPYIVSEVLDKDGKILASYSREVEGESLVKTENLALVREGMRQACLEGGTGWPFFTFGMEVGCKTGTAEFGDPNDRTHAWFTIFAPFDDPQISLTVLVEGGGEGSNVAAPVAREVLEWFFDKDKD